MFSLSGETLPLFSGRSRPGFSICHIKNEAYTSSVAGRDGHPWKNQTHRRYSMKAIVDPDLCTGCGLCPDICPQVFVLEGDTAKSMVETVPPDDEGSCQEAADACPVEAIQITQ
jgi:ferredoxin